MAAQDIIRTILVLSSLIANDADVSLSSGDNDRNYNVTAAEHVIPAYLRQISLATKVT